jgi:hypothetical protein
MTSKEKSLLGWKLIEALLLARKYQQERLVKILLNEMEVLINKEEIEDE